MDNKVIITAGYMGSGSSAVTDLLSEYEGLNCANSSFEYVFMHCPNGLFDLEDKLLVGNTALRSDEALHSFLDTMRGLYRKDGHWTGNYREKVSPDFYDDCRAFVDALSPYRFEDVYWYYQQNPVNLRMKAQLFLVRAALKATHGKLKLPRPVSYRETMFAFPEPEAFYGAAKQLLDRVFRAMGIEKSSIVLDQLLLPQNLNRLDRYFGDNARVIVVDRDPRDVYLSNKLIWKPQNWMIPLPTEAERFCGMYRSIRELGVREDPRVLKVHFEDLVYRYEETVARIEVFLGVDARDHARRFSRFDPKRSINNTQLFTRREFAGEDVSPLVRELGEYLYPFTEKAPDSASIKTIF